MTLLCFASRCCFSFGFFFFFFFGPVLPASSCQRDLSAGTWGHKRLFGQLLIHDSMGVLVESQKFTFSLPRLPKLLFWCLSELNPAVLRPATKMMNKDSRFSKKMQSNFSSRRHSCIGYVYACVLRVSVIVITVRGTWSTRMQMFRKFWKADFTCLCVWQVLPVFVFSSTWYAVGW